MAVLTEMTGCRVSPAAVLRFSLSCGGFRSVSTSSRGVEDFIRRVGKFRCRVEDFIRRVGKFRCRVEDFIRRVGKFRCRVEDFIRRVRFVLLGHRSFRPRFRRVLWLSAGERVLVSVCGSDPPHAGH